MINWSAGVVFSMYPNLKHGRRFRTRSRTNLEAHIQAKAKAKAKARVKAKGKALVTQSVIPVSMG